MTSSLRHPMSLRHPSYDLLVIYSQNATDVTVCTRRYNFVCLYIYKYFYRTYLYRTWLVHVGHDSFIWLSHSWGTWLVYERDMTHSNATCLVHRGRGMFMWDMTRSYETWLADATDTPAPMIHIGHDWVLRNLTRSFGKRLVHMGHDSFMGYMTR